MSERYDRQKDIDAVLRKNELYDGKGRDKISHAVKGKSGYSFGPAQWDMAQRSNKAQADAFVGILRKHAEKHGGIDEPTLGEIDTAVRQPGTSAVVEQNKRFIDAALSSDAGRQKITEMYDDHLKDLDRKVQGVIDAGPPPARERVTRPILTMS